MYVRTYVSVTLRNVNLHSRARSETRASRALTKEGRGQAEKNGASGSGGQCGWCVRTYVRVCHAQECQFALTSRNIRHEIRHGTYVTCIDTGMPSLAMEDREGRRFLTMEDG